MAVHRERDRSGHALRPFAKKRRSRRTLHPSYALLVCSTLGAKNLLAYASGKKYEHCRCVRLVRIAGISAAPRTPTHDIIRRLDQPGDKAGPVRWSAFLEETDLVASDDSSVRAGSTYERSNDIHNPCPRAVRVVNRDVRPELLRRVIRTQTVTARSPSASEHTAARDNPLDVPSTAH